MRKLIVDLIKDDLLFRFSQRLQIIHSVCGKFKFNIDEVIDLKNS